MPRVSVIIPTYNRADFIAYAIDSVLAQTLQDFEIIVADDGSTDETDRVLESYGDRVRYVRLDHSGLPATVRNAALQLAQGDYVAFLDSDDGWLPHKIEQQVRILDDNPNVGLVHSNALVLEVGQDKPSRLYFEDEKRRNGKVLRDLLQDNFVITSTAIVRRSLLKQAGSFDENRLLRAIEDYDLWLRIAALSEFYYVPEALAIYRDNSTSIRTQQTRVAYWQGLLLILERLKTFLKNSGYHDAIAEQLIVDLAYTYRRRLLKANWASARYIDAIHCALQLMSKRPKVFSLDTSITRRA